MDDVKLILDAIAEVKKDIEKLYDALDAKQKDIETLRSDIRLIDANGSNCRQTQSKNFDDVWRSIADVRKEIDSIKQKPDKDRGALAQWVGMLTGATGWIVLLLKTFGVIQ